MRGELANIAGVAGVVPLVAEADVVVAVDTLAAADAARATFTTEGVDPAVWEGV